MLTETEIQQLIKQFQDNHCQQSLNRLLKQYYPYICKVTMNYIKWLGMTHISYDDACQEATIGFYDAVLAFDHSRGFKFKTILIYKVKGAVLNMYRKDCILPSWLMDKIRVYKKYMVKHPNATDEQINADLELIVDQLKWIRKGMLMLTRTPFDDALHKSVEVEYDDIVITQQRNQLIKDIIKTFPERARDILEMFFFQGMTLQGIGDEMGLSRERVRQIKKEYLEKFKEIYQRRWEGKHG